MITFTDLDLILGVCLIGILFALTIFLCYFLIPQTNRVKFLNKLTRKNLGIIEVAGKGGEIDTFMVSFDKRVGETKSKVFLLNQDNVYRKDGVKHIHFNELDALDPVDFVGEAIPKNRIDEALASVGVVDGRIAAELKEKTMMDTKTRKFYLQSVSFRKLKPKEEYKNPETIKAVFMEQKALAEAKALLSDKMMRYLLIGAMVCGGLAFVTSYMTTDKMDNQLMPKVNSIAGTVADLQTKLVDLQTNVETLSTPNYNYPSGFVLPNGTVVK